MDDQARTRIGFFPTTFVLAASLLVAACGGAPKQANSEDDFGSKSDPATPTPSSGGDSSGSGSGSSSGDSAPASGGDPGGAGRLNKDQRAQIDIALRRGRDKAVQCPDVVPNSPSGDAEVKVTFDGKKGRSVDASVGPPFAGTPIEGCIKRAFIDEIVVPFDGGNLDMPTTVKITAKAAPATDDKKKPKK